MYGMIHRAARDFAMETLDEQVWQSILTKINFDNGHFISGQHYSDEDTFALIGALSEHLNTPVPGLLTAFGRYWIQFTGRSDYAAALAMAGDDLVTFLCNLDELHHGIQANMPDARLPSFSVLSSDEDQIVLLYTSERQGLESFVEGLLQGLLAKFSESGAISHQMTDAGVEFRIDRSESATLAA